MGGAQERGADLVARSTPSNEVRAYSAPLIANGYFLSRPDGFAR